MTLLPRPLAVGTPAPDFALQDQEGNSLTLSSLRGRPVLLVFYPGDETPVCRKQLCELRDRWTMVESRGIRVLGINPQSQASHRKFRDRNRLPFPLLVDVEHRVAKLYRSWFLWTLRSVYLIGSDGNILYSRRGKPSPEQVLATLPDGVPARPL